MPLTIHSEIEFTTAFAYLIVIVHLRVRAAIMSKYEQTKKRPLLETYVELLFKLQFGEIMRIQTTPILDEGDRNKCE